MDFFRGVSLRSEIQRNLLQRSIEIVKVIPLGKNGQNDKLETEQHTVLKITHKRYLTKLINSILNSKMIQRNQINFKWLRK